MGNISRDDKSSLALMPCADAASRKYEWENSVSVSYTHLIRFLAAECRLIQGFIIGAGAQIRKALPDGAVLHRGNPKTEDRLAASGHFIHQSENQLTFTPGVTGIDNGIHVGAVHQGAEIFKSVLLAGCLLYTSFIQKSTFLLHFSRLYHTDMNNSIYTLSSSFFTYL